MKGSEITIPWGHWTSDGEWHYNPLLAMSLDVQFAENSKNGYFHVTRRVDDGNPTS